MSASDSGTVENSAAGAPNQYHLHGGGMSVNYFPQGMGPVHPGGPGRLTYQDPHRAVTFGGDEIRTVEVPDIGTVVSVTLVRSVDTGFTTFSVLIPQVVLPDQLNASAPIQTKGITTIHRVFAGAIGHAQREVYTVTRLAGTAVRGILGA